MISRQTRSLLGALCVPFAPLRETAKIRVEDNQPAGARFIVEIPTLESRT